MYASRRPIRFVWRTACFVVLLVCLSHAQQTDIQNLVAGGNLEGMRWPNFSDYQKSVQEFYAPAGFAPAWVQGSQPIPQALAMVGVFKDAAKKGLDPEAYDASRWEERIRALQSASSGSAVASFDVALTVCTMRYVSDLRIGRINPQHFSFGLGVEQKKYDLAQFLRDRILTASDLTAVLDETEPPFAAYRRTEQALADYVDLARTDDWEKLPDVTKPIDPGQVYAGVPRLSQFFATRGRSARRCARFPPTRRSTAGRWWRRSNASSAGMAWMTMAASVPPPSSN